MKLKINSKINREIIHYADSEVLISSKYRTIYFEKRNQLIRKVTLPESPIMRLFGILRLTRRALRLDKCNVFPVGENLIIIRKNKVYFFDAKNNELSSTLQLKNCRTILHQSISQTPEGSIYFGEYGANKERTTVPVYRSTDGGRTWEEIYTFEAGSIKHIHGCYYDKYTDKIWVCTGDFENENWLVVADKDFKNVRKIGDGQQRFRTCNLFFTENKVHWLMDSQLEPSYQISLDRETEKIEIGTKFSGPVWYIKSLSDGYFLAGTTQENGEGVLDDKAHLCVSTDFINWTDLHLFEHDGLPKKYFKNGIIGFADGEQSSKEFYLFFEAIKGFDGKSIKCEIA